MSMVPPNPTRRTTNVTKVAETTRLEELWAGEFGDAYTDRNDVADAELTRLPFWTNQLAAMPAARVLEVGCNIGSNLGTIAHLGVEPRHIYGVDVNMSALRIARRRLPEVNTLWCPGRELPFRDGWFDLVFTLGVLIHQPDATLPLVMAEMVRASSRWVLCGEYVGSGEEVPYRGQEGALFRRDYGGLFAEMFPELEQIGQGFVGRNQGFDDVTWWAFEKGTS